MAAPERVLHEEEVREALREAWGSLAVGLDWRNFSSMIESIFDEWVR